MFNRNLKKIMVVFSMTGAVMLCTACGKGGVKYNTIKNEETSETTVNPLDDASAVTGNSDAEASSENSGEASSENSSEISTDAVTAETTTAAGSRAASGYMYATQLVNVRSGPGTEYSALGKLQNGQQVEIVSQSSNGWYQIVFDNQTAYVSNAYLASNLTPEKQWTDGEMYTVAQVDGKYGYYYPKFVVGTDTVEDSVTKENNVKTELDNNYYKINSTDGSQSGWQSKNLGLYNVNGTATYVWFVYRDV